ncbi:hypothetical protein KZC51_10410 [Microbacterium sp. SSW1-49]|uniref:Nitrate ABC transporter substrate-binding protein n=1 Tax=Microbacterium croceum TaxID=2851645 RepID=A0ABT0FEQ3_9MICO|nr:hypothetical protein [Microbacterium croceum]MCK2036549.1 hypothetical protein [Microbacterium croceum]
MIPRITSATAGVLLLLAALTACAGPAEPAPSPTTSASTPAPSATAAPTDAPTPEEPAAELTCESMISAGTVEALTSAGWTAKPKEFVIGDVDLTDGLLCFWADYAVGSDHGQLYGWSPISAEDATAAQAALLASGWRREDGPEGTYITEDPQYSMGTDDDGYGMTYLFHDGWVKLADTRQGLVLIEWAG